jgi:hypothetical protein
MSVGCCVTYSLRNTWGSQQMKLETSVKHQLKRIRETSRVFPKRTELASGNNREFATVRVGGTKAGPVDRTAEPESDARE